MEDVVRTLRVPFERQRKKSRHLLSPFTAQPPTTRSRARKCRARSKIYKSKMDSLFQPGESVLEPWREVRTQFWQFIDYLIIVFYLINHVCFLPKNVCQELKREAFAPEGAVVGHSEIQMLLRNTRKVKFNLPWFNGDLYKPFWAALVCKDGNRRGWLSDEVHKLLSCYLNKSLNKFVIMVLY